MDLVNELMFVIFPIIGIVSLVAVPTVGLFIWKRWLPKPARTLFWAKRRSQIPILIVHDSGRGDLQLITERLGSGVVYTNTNKWKLLPKFVSSKLSFYRDIVPKKAELTQQALMRTEDNGEDPQEPAPDKTEAQQILDGTLKEYERDYSDWINKRCNLIGMDMPFYVGYSGILCLLSPEALALYEAGELIIPSDHGDLYRGDPDKKKDATRPLLLIEPRKIKEMVNESFDETQIAAIATEAERMGALGRGFGKFLPIMIIIIFIIIAIAAIFILPSILPKK